MKVTIIKYINIKNFIILFIFYHSYLIILQQSRYHHDTLVFTSLKLA
jgi:hypothetical protein